MSYCDKRNQLHLIIVNKSNSKLINKSISTSQLSRFHIDTMWRHLLLRNNEQVKAIRRQHPVMESSFRWNNLPFTRVLKRQLHAIRPLFGISFTQNKPENTRSTYWEAINAWVEGDADASAQRILGHLAFHFDFALNFVRQSPRLSQTTRLRCCESMLY